MPSHYANKSGRRVKRNPKREWRASPKERRKAREAFKPKLLPAKATPARSIITALQKEMRILQRKSGNLGEREVLGAILNVVGVERAKAFVESHADIMAKAVFEGFSPEVFGETPPAEMDAGRMRTLTLRQDRNLAKTKPRQWYALSLQRLKKAGVRLDPVIAKDYWIVVNKILEREASKIMKNFRENSVDYLEHRGFGIRAPDGSIYPASREYLNIIERNFSRHILYGEFGFAELEKTYISLDKSNRTNFQNLRKKVREIVRGEVEKNVGEFNGQKIRLVKGSPEHRAIVREIVTQVFRHGVIEYNERNSMPPDAVLAGRASRLVKREVDKMARQAQMEEAARRVELMKNKGRREAPITTREERIEQYSPRKKPVEPEAVRKIAEPEARPIARSQRYRDLRRLKTEAPNVYRFIFRNRKKGMVPQEIIENMVPKLLTGELPRRATNEAVRKGFEKVFPAEAMPTLIYTLTGLGNLQLKGSMLRKKVKNSCSKTSCRGKYVSPVINFLLSEGVLERHHSKKGRGALLAISRKFE